MTGSEAQHIQPPDNAHWQATVTGFREYLAGCRAWLSQYQKLTPTAEAAPQKSGKGIGLAKDALNHRSEHVYLLSSEHERQPTIALDRSGAMPLWAIVGDETELSASRKRKPKAA